jgi:hypothetical protein
MVDVDTFLTTLSVMVDDVCKTALPCKEHPGPQGYAQPERGGDLGDLWAMAGLWQ